MSTSESSPKCSSTSTISIYCCLIAADRFDLTSVEIKGLKDDCKDLVKTDFSASQAIPDMVPTNLIKSFRPSETARFISPDAPISTGTPSVGSTNLTLESVPHFTAI